jgi:hypothetical protein
MTSLLVAGSPVLAAVATEQNNFGDTRSGALAGPLGLVFILLLALATILLIRNMNSRIRRLPDSFDKPGPGDGSGSAAEGGSTGEDTAGPDDAAAGEAEGTPSPEANDKPARDG